MSRIRTIKPDIWICPRFACCSPHARLLFLGLLNFSDDWGRHRAEPLALKMAILANDAADVAALLDELCDAGLVGCYSTEAGEFLQVLGFLRHQRVDRRKPPRWPTPSDENLVEGTPRPRWKLFFDDLDKLLRKSIDDASTTDRGARNDDSVQISAEGKGVEGNGRDQGRDKEEGRDASPSPAVPFPTQNGKHVELQPSFLHDLEARYSVPVVRHQLQKYARWVDASENGVRPDNVERWITSKLAEDMRQGGGRGGGPAKIDEAEFLAAMAGADK